MLLEIGFSRQKNVGTVVAKVIANFSIASLCYWGVGFALAFGGAGALWGSHGFFLHSGTNDGALFPAMSADLFGRKFATTNYGILYTSKGLASLLIPVGNIIQQATGSWTPVYVVAIVFDVIAAVLAITALRPLARRHLQRASLEAAPSVVPTLAGASE